MIDYHIPLLPDGEYHLFNRSIGNEKIFIEEMNYEFFLGKCKKHIWPIAEVFSYSLLPDHFHFLVKIKPIEAIKRHFRKKKPGKDLNEELLSDFIMERFSNFLNSYTKSFNKTYNRKGALFIDYTRRVRIENNADFCATAFQIHNNQVYHGYCTNPYEWKWSSYNEDWFSTRKKLMDRFGGRDAYLKYHQQPSDMKDCLLAEI